MPTVGGIGLFSRVTYKLIVWFYARIPKHGFVFVNVGFALCYYFNGYCKVSSRGATETIPSEVILKNIDLIPQ